MRVLDFEAVQPQGRKYLLRSQVPDALLGPRSILPAPDELDPV